MRSGLGLALGLLLGACSSAPIHTAPPPGAYEAATVPGYGPIRFWADARPEGGGSRLNTFIEQFEERFADEIAAGGPIGFNILALSGGGADGAFGAGLLNGWSRAGTRPEFDVVTGISTGALIAPFAFLGSGWDDELKEVYTTLSTDNLLVFDFLDGLLGGVALADAAPFRRTIARYVTQEMLDLIAVEHARGRRLFVGTSALDAARPVVWNIGAIAASGRPDALQLVRDILQASASIPGAFPPVLIDVEVDGQRYGELHVDGGVTSQIFVYPAEFSARELFARLPVEVDATIYAIRNKVLRPPYETVTPGVLSLVSRSISVLLAYQGIGDLYRIATRAERDGIAFRLMSIPEGWVMVPDELFDPVYMTALFAVGEDIGAGEIPWRRQPRSRAPAAPGGTKTYPGNR